MTTIAVEKKEPLIIRPVSKKPVNKDSIEAITKETDRMVTGTFVNIENPGQPSPPMCCRFYKGQQFQNYTFQDGQTYTIPLSMARHINENCKHVPIKWSQDERGNPKKSEGAPIARFKFMADF